MKAYVSEKNQNDQKDQELISSQDEFFENIDSVEENDEKNQEDQFMYNLDINFSSICKKCEISRETFKFNNFFDTHIRNYIDDESKLSILNKIKT